MILIKKRKIKASLLTAIALIWYIITYINVL